MKKSVLLCTQRLGWRSVWTLLLVLPTVYGFAFDPAVGDLQKASPDHIRVLSYNTERKFIVNTASDPEFERVIKAINPDVIAFQEITYPSLTETDVETLIKGRLEGYFPSDTWSVNVGNTDGFVRNALASRFPLSMKVDDTVPASEVRGVVGALIDLPDANFGSTDFYVMCVHFKSFGTQNDHRRRQIYTDAIVNWMRDAQTSGCTDCPAGDQINLPNGTPMLTVGDMNLGYLDGGDYAPYHPTRTLRDGDIYDEATFGPDVAPDWDNSETGDAAPYDHTTGDSHTQPSDTGDPNSRLDRFVYTDSVLHVENRFVLNTLNLSGPALAAAGLQSNDTVRDANGAPDHLPVVVDFALGADPAAPGQLVVNEFSYDDVGIDSWTFVELKNVGGQPINLEAPFDYHLLVSFNNVPTTIPGTENERDDHDLQGIIPPGGLFVIYDSSADSVDVASSITTALPLLQRQDFADFTGTFLLNNGPDAGFALVAQEPWITESGTDTTTDTLVERYLYEDSSVGTPNYLRTDGGNLLVIEFGDDQSSTAFLSSDTQSFSRRVGDTTLNSFASWRIPDTMTPGQENASVLNTSPILVVNVGLQVGRGETAALNNTALQVSDAQQAAANLVFTILQFPSHGTLRRGTTDLSPSGETTFTQADLDTGNLSYVHSGVGSDPDSFTFVVADGDGGGIASTPFSITIVAPAAVADWTLFR